MRMRTQTHSNEITCFTVNVHPTVHSGLFSGHPNCYEVVAAIGWVQTASTAVVVVTHATNLTMNFILLSVSGRKRSASTATCFVNRTEPETRRAVEQIKVPIPRTTTTTGPVLKAIQSRNSVRNAVAMTASTAAATVPRLWRRGTSALFCLLELNTIILEECTVSTKETI